MTTTEIAKITIDQIESVYSGRAGKCACGCSGKYWYSTRHADTAKARGGVVSDRQVRRVLAIVQEHAAEATTNRTYASVEIDGRWYIVHLPDADVATELVAAQ